ncbi:hypothetical protein A2160_02910 [Candidatus Beckwithbacteria bacterium RBG_13_42_9]|uniref:Glycosyltransferase RgtA/B/C/D-like domain-containing protein n=1 Tax=Candidatus Beckwithbacteria bacterium RBG_13_42_9 TaxID=1797457 RepID=A0A1F5E7M4_9BACT|nr:MAG: hypothetical protein A2160_02910 [Candidatus Beckwithbacteria bacterium RBG_13_42_9]
MKIFPLNKIIISLISVWLTVLIGVGLRVYKADVFPIDNNDDGLFYAWAGNSFLSSPLNPVTHSIFDKDNPALIWRSQYFDYLPIERFGMKIVRPWFDHPPLATVLIALPAHLLGYREMTVIPQLIIRFPALVASILTLFFTYLIARDLFGEKVGQLSLLFLATIPYFVIAHRQSFIENFLTPLFLICLILLRKYLRSASKTKLILLVALSFLVGWFKVIGFILTFSLAGWLILKKRLRESLYLLLTSFISILSYLAYGFLANPEIFLKTLLNQQVRGAYVTSFFYSLTRIQFYGSFQDGWYVLGLVLALFLTLRARKEETKFFAWFFTCWLLALFLLSGRFNNSPWYRYPLLPFMATALGFYADRLLKKPQFFLLLPFFLLGLTGLDLINFDLNSTVLRLLVVVFFLPYLLNFLIKNKRLQSYLYWTTGLFLTILVLINIVVTLKYPSLHCSQEQCLAPQKIVLPLR